MIIYKKQFKNFARTILYRYRLLNNISKELENVRIKKLLKTATIIGSNGGNCNILTCTLIKNKKPKNSSIFKF